MFYPKKSPLLGDLGAFLDEKSGLFYSKNTLARANFRGIDGVIETPFAEEFPLKVMELGRCGGGRMGEKCNKKGL